MTGSPPRGKQFRGTGHGGGADHQGDGQAPAAASSPSPSTHGASGPRTRSCAQRGPRRTGARHDVEDHDDDDDDEGDGDDHGAQPSEDFCDTSLTKSNLTVRG
ncbi:hypothetical protein PTSG_12664 [Salpingoeca rosetta]|uniref:Uncharacterized protein n=1 Tax=Salpingoeca rosetta (strain ATCC 50818 / BSB-021) TaxID=946362 RepID=F2UGV7_SALR5|nr:uncharacterized protein PTSG_12664 [Salpingoeca rosetta]EGD75857.1 hypothetical protein PTSG_12664 [Salpingoeca rosetta]|eukprot:XP_004991778.1 hypothetical protein PTSG_12664 [Salpingoeca rosetta]